MLDVFLFFPPEAGLSSDLEGPPDLRAYDMISQFPTVKVLIMAPEDLLFRRLRHSERSKAESENLHSQCFR